MFRVWWAVEDLRSWGVGSWIRVEVLSLGANKDDSIVGEDKVCIFVASWIQIVVTSSVDTPSGWVVELYCI